MENFDAKQETDLLVKELGYLAPLYYEEALSIAIFLVDKILNHDSSKDWSLIKLELQKLINEQ